VLELRSELRILVVVVAIGLLGGLLVGLVLGWIVWPVQLTNIDIVDLKPSAQEDYITLTAQTFMVDKDLTRAKERLAQLHDSRINDRIVALARKLAVNGIPSASQVAALAVALGSTDPQIALIATTATPTITLTPTPSLTPTPTETLPPTLTLTPTPTITPTVTSTRAPRPTTRPSSTPTAAPAPITTAWQPALSAWPGSVKFEPALVSSGQKYWRLAKAVYCDSNDDHDYCRDLPGGGVGTSTYIILINSAGARVKGVPIALTTSDGKVTIPDEKSASDMCNCNYSYESDGSQVKVNDGASDKMSGMSLYSVKAHLSNFHVRYFLTFQLVTR
jgi:hypothetical protein